MKFFALILIPFLLILASCGSEDGNNGFREVKEFKNILALQHINDIKVQDDSTQFISQIYSASVDQDGNLYVIDKDKKKIFKLNDKGNITAVSGGTGQGPTEFDMPLWGRIFKEKLYIVDVNNNKINKYDLGLNYLETIPMEAGFYPVDFDILNDSLMVFSYLQGGNYEEFIRDNTFFIFNINSKHKQFFGGFPEEYHEYKILNSTISRIQADKTTQELYVIFYGSRYIHKYDLRQQQKLYSFGYEDERFPFVNKDYSLQWTFEKKLKYTSSYVWNQYIYLLNNNYLVNIYVHPTKFDETFNYSFDDTKYYYSILSTDGDYVQKFKEFPGKPLSMIEDKIYVFTDNSPGNYTISVYKFVAL